MSSYEKVKGGKLSFKSSSSGGEKTIAKKRRKKKKKSGEEEDSGNGEVEVGAGAGAGIVKAEGYEIDTGIGHAPDGKKSKKYEELFPVETKRFGYELPVSKEQSREDALDERVKKKADRYCK